MAATPAKPAAAPGGLQSVLDAINAGAPPSAGTVDTPVGVPKGYKTPAGVAPQYFAADKFTPGSWTPETIAQLQMRMESAGLYVPGTEPSKTGKLGWWDSTTDATAYTNVLTNANSAGKDWASSLDDLMSLAATQGPAIKRAKVAASRTPMVTQYTNPEDLKYVAQKTAQATMGMNLSDDDLTKFMQGFHGMEATQTSQAYQAGTPGGAGGSYTAAPNIDSAAAAFTQQQHPTETYAKKYVDAFNTFDTMLNATTTGARPGTAGGTTGV